VSTLTNLRDGVSTQVAPRKVGSAGTISDYCAGFEKKDLPRIIVLTHEGEGEKQQGAEAHRNEVPRTEVAQTHHRNGDGDHQHRKLGRNFFGSNGRVERFSFAGRKHMPPAHQHGGEDAAPDDGLRRGSVVVGDFASEVITPKVTA